MVFEPCKDLCRTVVVVVAAAARISGRTYKGEEGVVELLVCCYLENRFQAEVLQETAEACVAVFNHGVTGLVEKACEGEVDPSKDIKSAGRFFDCRKSLCEECAEELCVVVFVHCEAIYGAEDCRQQGVRL